MICSPSVLLTPEELCCWKDSWFWGQRHVTQVRLCEQMNVPLAYFQLDSNYTVCICVSARALEKQISSSTSFCEGLQRLSLCIPEIHMWLLDIKCKHICLVTQRFKREPHACMTLFRNISKTVTVLPPQNLAWNWIRLDIRVWLSPQLWPQSFPDLDSCLNSTKPQRWHIKKHSCIWNLCKFGDSLVSGILGISNRKASNTGNDGFMTHVLHSPSPKASGEHDNNHARKHTRA